MSLLLDKMTAEAKGWRYARFGSDERTAWRRARLPRWLRTTLTLALIIVLLLVSGRILSSWHAARAVRERQAFHERASKHLVIASFAEQNVSWLADIPSSWTVKRYIMDDPSPEPPLLAVPRNHGREAMAYLTYIIDHYDALPDYMIFTHGHERSWHQPELLQQKVRALNLTALDEERYVSLRCGVQMGCERPRYIDTRHVNWSGEDRLCEFWSNIDGGSCPRYLSFKCCGQHAVTRQAVLARSKAQWMRARAPLTGDSSMVLENDWIAGELFEKFWHVLFGMPSQHCPSPETCRQVHFSNAIICDGDTDTTPFEGDLWKEVQCVSAFDDIGRDEPPGPAMQNFSREFLHTWAQVRRKYGERRKEQLEAWEAAQHDVEI